MGDWDGVRLWGGGDVAQVRARLNAGADPCAPSGAGGWTMLHAGAELASPEVVTAMAGRTLSTGTIAYGVYANPKSGNQGSMFTDGTITGWDLHPGGSPREDATSDEVLLSYVYRSNAAAYACGYAGLHPPNARPVTGPPDAWVLLPERDYWHDSLRS